MFRKSRKVSLPEIVAKFLRFMAKKVGAKPCEFNVRKGKIFENRVRTNSKLLISVRDPFNKYLNHGSSLKHRDQFKDIVQEFTNLLEAFCDHDQSRLLDYIYGYEPVIQ